MSILICTPCYGNMVTSSFAKSCLDLQLELIHHGIVHEFLFRGNESLVHRARMGMTKTFLDSDYDNMMWIDADMDFKPDDVEKIFALNADISVGVYRMKHEGSLFAAWVDGELVTDLDKFDGPVEVDYAGTGFMLIKREVLEDLSAKVPKYENEVKDIPALYQTPIHDGILLSEDYFFCKLARDNGYKIIMDPSVRPGHWGLSRYG